MSFLRLGALPAVSRRDLLRGSSSDSPARGAIVRSHLRDELGRLPCLLSRALGARFSSVLEYTAAPRPAAGLKGDSREGVPRLRSPGPWRAAPRSRRIASRVPRHDEDVGTKERLATALRHIASDCGAVLHGALASRPMVPSLSRLAIELYRRTICSGCRAGARLPPCRGDVSRSIPLPARELTPRGRSARRSCRRSRPWLHRHNIDCELRARMRTALRNCG